MKYFHVPNGAMVSVERDTDAGALPMLERPATIPRGGAVQGKVGYGRVR